MGMGMGMGKKLVNLTIFVLFVAVIVMRTPIAEYFENNDVFSEQFITALLAGQQQPTDITSLSHNPSDMDNNIITANKTSDNNKIVIKETSSSQAHEQKKVYEESISTNTPIKTPVSQLANSSSVKSQSDIQRLAGDPPLSIIDPFDSPEMIEIKKIAAENFLRLKTELALLEKNRIMASSAKKNIIEKKKVLKQKQDASRKKEKVVATIVTTKAPQKKQPNIQSAYEPLVSVPANKNTLVALKLNTPINTATLTQSRKSILKKSVEKLNKQKAQITKKIATAPIVFRRFDDEEMVIIVNSSNTQLLTISDIKNMYTDRITSWSGGEKIKLYNLPVDSPTREIFSEKILDQSSWEAARAESNRVVKNVLRNVTEIRTARLIVSTVAKSPNAIGYVPYKKVMGKNNLRIVIPVSK